MSEEIKIDTEGTETNTEQKVSNDTNATNAIVTEMINNGVTKEELKEVLADFFKKEEPQINVEEKSREYFTSLLHGVK